MGERRRHDGLPPEVVLTVGHNYLRKLTREIRDLDRRAGHGEAEARVGIGQRLSEARGRMDHGGWLDWVEHQLPLGVRSAQLCMQLSDWAAAQPRLYRRVAPLGFSKVLLLSRLEPDRLRSLLRVKQHRVPGTPKAASLELLTHSELSAVLRELMGEIAAPTSDKLLNNYRRRVRGLLEATNELARSADELDADDIEELRAQLLKAASHLQRALR